MVVCLSPYSSCPPATLNWISGREWIDLDGTMWCWCLNLRRILFSQREKNDHKLSTVGKKQRYWWAATRFSDLVWCFRFDYTAPSVWGFMQYAEFIFLTCRNYLSEWSNKNGTWTPTTEQSFHTSSCDPLILLLNSAEHRNEKTLLDCG